MKKLLSLFAFVAIVLTFAACGGNTPELKDFTIEMKTISVTDASFTITPADPNAEYYWYVYPKCWVAWDIRDGYCSSEEDFIDKTLEVWVNPKYLWAYDKSIMGQHGTATISEEDVRKIINGFSDIGLAPNYEHRIAVCKIDADMKRVGDITFYSFNTLMPAGYVDLGLPSGNLWTTRYTLENSQPVYYTYEQACDKGTYSYDWFPYTNTWQELRDQCTWTWESNMVINGYRVTSKTNGNSIFLPAAGHKNASGQLFDVGSKGIYWTIDPGDNNNYHYAAIFTKDSYNHAVYSNQCSFSFCFFCPGGELYYYY